MTRRAQNNRTAHDHHHPLYFAPTPSNGTDDEATPKP